VAVIAGAVAVALAAALVVALIDDGSDEPRSQTTSTAPPASFPSSTADTDAAAPAPSPTPTVAPTTEPPAGSVLEDGRHAVFLTGLDVDARTVDFDVIQFLMGDEATAAYHEDHPEDPDAPPNDYYIVNDNPRLRKLPVDANVEVIVLDAIQPQTIAFADLPARLAGDLVPDDQRIWHNPFWLTVESGTVTAIHEQYIP
jgi:hypothetical protein